MTCTLFDLAGLEVCESNTTYLVRVINNHYRACEFRKDVQVDTVAKRLLPPGFYVEEMKGGRHCMFRALAHLWHRDSDKHDDVRQRIVCHIVINWRQRWWSTHCRPAFPEYINEHHTAARSMLNLPIIV